MKSRTKNDLAIPHLSRKDLIKKANDFLDTYNRENTVPVPIEHIAEYSLSIEIIPTRGLEKMRGIDAFINSRLDSIFIDENTYLNQEERTRFSVAHEIAHKVLHKEFYESLKIEDEESYLDFQENGDADTKRWMEWQAYIFAGYLVLPQRVFNPRFEELFENLTVVDIDELAQIMRILAEEFKVSGDCLQKQIEREYPELIRDILNNNLYTR